MGTAVPEVGVDASCPVVEALTAARPRRWLVPLVSPVIQKVVVLTGMSGRAVPPTLTCQWVVPAGAGGKVSRRAPSRDSTAGAAGVSGVMSTATVGADQASVAPTSLVAVSANLRYRPRSAVPGQYVVPVADVATHDVTSVGSAHQYQRRPVVRSPEPVAERHVPDLPVSDSPTRASP